MSSINPRKCSPLHRAAHEIAETQDPGAALDQDRDGLTAADHLHEVLYHLHEMGESSSSLPARLIHRLHAITTEGGPHALPYLLHLAAGGWGQWDTSLSDRGHEEGVSKQAIHKKERKVASELREKFAELADLIETHGGRLRK